MRLYVLDLHAVQAGKLAQGPELVDELIVDLIRRDAYLPAPETDQIPVAVVNSDRDAVLFGQLNGPPHDVRVARVEAARHVGRRDVAHELLVSPEAVGSEALAHVAVEIYLHLSPSGRRAFGLVEPIPMLLLSRPVAGGVVCGLRGLRRGPRSGNGFCRWSWSGRVCRGR